MKITPLEIRKKTFEKQMRGYDKEEVNAFLLSLSHEWEHALEQIKSLESQLAKMEADVEKLRQVESSLYKTLKTAEDTGSNMIDQAKKTAELHLKETQMNADALLNESKSRARTIIEDAELKAKDILDGVENEVKELGRIYAMLENHRDEILNELTNLSTITLQRVQKVSDNLTHFDVDKKLAEIREEALEKASKEKAKPVAAPRETQATAPVQNPANDAAANNQALPPNDDLIDEPENQEPEDSLGNGSFFDQLD